MNLKQTAQFTNVVSVSHILFIEDLKQSATCTCTCIRSISIRLLFNQTTSTMPERQSGTVGRAVVSQSVVRYQTGQLW